MDHEPAISNLIRQVLERVAYRVIMAHDGIQALAVADAFQDDIHLLLTEIDLPRMSGVELARQLLRTRPGIRVLLMSGRPAENDSEFLFLAKPFDIDMLRTKVHKALNTGGNAAG